MVEGGGGVGAKFNNNFRSVVSGTRWQLVKKKKKHVLISC